LPYFNGTGPKCEGPLTGRGMGYCMLKTDPGDPSHIEGFAGMEGNLYIEKRKEGTIMPVGDRTGPAGMGPMTGRAAGYCAGHSVPGYMNAIPGRGMGFGRGGWGRRNRFYATGLTGWQRASYGYPAYGLSMTGAHAPYEAPPVPTKDQEMDMLRDQAKYLEESLSGINKRIKELETEKK